MATIANSQASYVMNETHLQRWYIEYLQSDGFSMDAKDVQFLTDFKRTLNHLEKKRKAGRTNQFLRRAFLKIHDKYLINYEADAEFAELSRGGTYNCLTATALYGMAFDWLGIDYNVIEKKNHIFIVADGDQPIVLETTDGIDGFVRDPAEVDEIIRSGDIVRFSLSNQEVLGLMYFNRAARGYLNGDLDETIESVELANKYYKGARMDVLHSFTSRKIR